MRKIYKELTEEQKNRGVIFSSCLQGDGMIQKEHEVLESSDDKDETIARLKDDSFFNNSPFSVNVIRQ